MSPVCSAVRCWEQLCEPAFFRHIAAMSGNSVGESGSPHHKYTAQDRAIARDALRSGRTPYLLAVELGIPAGTLFRWRSDLIRAGEVIRLRRRRRNANGKFEVSV